MQDAEWWVEPDLLVVKFKVLNVGEERTIARLRTVVSMTQGHNCQRVLFIVRSRDDYDYSVFDIVDGARMFIENFSGLRVALVDNTPSSSPARKVFANGVFQLLVPDKIFTIRYFLWERPARFWLDALPARNQTEPKSTTRFSATKHRNPFQK